MSSTTYRYTAIGADNQVVKGDIAAESLDEAYRLLVVRGLRSVRVAEVVASVELPESAHEAARAPGCKPLTPAEALVLAEHLEALAKSGLPLGPGLRAAAEEFAQPRLTAAFIELADSLERGRPLDEILAAQPQIVPPQVGRLIEAGVRSGRLAEVLTQLLDIDRTSRDLWRRVRVALSYPLLLIAAYVGLLVFVGIFILPDIVDMYYGFGLKLPSSTVTLLFWFAGNRMFVTLGIVAAAVPMLILFYRAALPPVLRCRILARVPFFGPLVFWRNVVYWVRLLGLFVEYEIPLADSLRLAADGINDENIARESRIMARAVAAGRTLADALTAERRLPQSLVPLVRWGEQNGTLADALRTAGDMFENRVLLRIALIEAALPPMMFVLIALGVVAILNAMLAPMVDLIRALS